MPTLTIEYATDAERLALEQAIAFFSGLRLTAHTAPHGSVLAACERLALTDGRTLVRDTPDAADQARADADGATTKPAAGTRAAAAGG